MIFLLFALEANFAQSFRIVETIYGPGSIGVHVIDTETGDRFPFPYGGDLHWQLNLDYTVGSSTVTVTWKDADWDNGHTCITQELVWDGQDFLVVSERQFPAPEFGFCSPN